MSFRRNRTFVVAWLTPLLVALAALGLPASGMAAGTGIKGTVTTEGGGATGLAEVEVCVSEIVGEGSRCGETGSNGEYEVLGLTAGQYKVHFVPEEVNYVAQYYSGKSSWETATPVSVVAGGITPGINAMLEKGAKINGVVTAAATGQPVAGVSVCAFGVTVEIFRCDESNGVGSYSIVGLAGGQYEVEFFPEETEKDLVAAPYSLGLVTVQAKGEANGINQALQPGGQISGTVRAAATGAPLAGVRVCLSEAELLEPLGCLTTPASGGYRFTGIWRGSFKVVFSAAANEFPDGHPIVDAYPTQWWQGASSFATATPIAITPPAIVEGVDGALGPPPTVTPPVVVPPTRVVKKKALKKPKPLKCRHGFTKRKVHGKAKCVRRHKAVKHRHGHQK